MRNFAHQPILHLAQFCFKRPDVVFSQVHIFTTQSILTNPSSCPLYYFHVPFLSQTLLQSHSIRLAFNVEPVRYLFKFVPHTIFKSQNFVFRINPSRRLYNTTRINCIGWKLHEAINNGVIPIMKQHYPGANLQKCFEDISRLYPYFFPS